jgi:ABC-type lipoprotein export system ATPase subunit
MTAGIELRRALEAGNAFDSMPLPGARRALYVSFEELMESSIEASVRRDVKAARRVALIGPVGSGKSSLIDVLELGASSSQSTRSTAQCPASGRRSARGSSTRVSTFRRSRPRTS